MRDDPYIYFAPLEGITGYIFRNNYDRYFGGIDAYYTPFLTTRDGGIMKKKELRDILPENNRGLHTVPQLMTKNADEFITAAKHIESLGYREVNLNLGCPSKTVVPKGKGSGFLKHPDELDRFLDRIFSECDIDIYIKSRIGFHSPVELPALLNIYKKYPIKLLILHLRTGDQFYKGEVYRDAFWYAYEELRSTNIPLCYNGDVRVDCRGYGEDESGREIHSVMIGRGFLANPGFMGNEDLKGSYRDQKRVREFVMNLQSDYEQVLYGETPVLFKMKELWSHLAASFVENEDIFKRIKKAKTLRQLESVYEEVF